MRNNSAEEPGRHPELRLCQGFASCVLVVAALACSSPIASTPDGHELVNGGAQPQSGLLPAPPHGVQYRMSLPLAPAEEGEYCQFVQISSDGIILNKDETRFGPGVHHFLVYETAYRTIPETTDDGVPVDTSGLFDCTKGPTLGWTITGFLGGSQTAHGAPTIDLPEGVGIRIAPNTVLLLNGHFLNVTESELTAEVAINLHTITERQLEVEGGFLVYYNLFIHVGAGTTGNAAMSCPVSADLSIVNAQSHMHRRGRHFEAVVQSADAGLVPLYTTDAWQDVMVHKWDEPLKVSAGSRIHYRCDYTNDEPREVLQGRSSQDEMCMLLATYYPKDSKTALCPAQPADPFKTRWLGADWEGSGTQTCAETLACFKTAGMPNPSDSASLGGIAKCIAQSRGTDRQLISQTLRCVMGDPTTPECNATLGECLQGVQ